MSRFQTLKIAELKLLLTAVGAKTSGTKPQLITQLEHELKNPRHTLSKHRPTRILSVDMGLKNMAFCVCDARKQEKGFHLSVREWHRIAVLEDSRLADHSDLDGSDPFGPSALSMKAHKLVRGIFLPHKVDTVLIERQRFRSGNSSAVQEWTLRVNMFESMIWAVFRALQNVNDQTKQQLWPVNPKQVANFWIGGDAPTGGASARRAKIEKKQKVDLVKKWLGDEGADRMSLDFIGSASETRDEFLHANVKRVVSRKQESQSRVSGDRAGKLDDLADSLLQAAAWCKWEENRDLLTSLIRGEDGVSGDQMLKKLMEGATSNVEVDEEWKPDDSHSDFWGADETQYWEQKATEDKKDAKLEWPCTTKKASSRKVTRLSPEVIEWEQPDIHGKSMVEQIKEEHHIPQPITYTVVNPDTDMSLPENRRRLFSNLHRQLVKEVGKALECGSWERLEPVDLKEAQNHAAKPVECWEDMDRTTLEPRIRELVRMLIAKRREVELS